MKYSYSLLGLYALGVYGAPVEQRSYITKRAAVPINAGALALIQSVEGFDGNFYFIDGDKTIGM